MENSTPTEMGLLTQLTCLDLTYNKLTGALPTEVGLLTQLTALRLHNNQLTGIPTEIGSLTPGTFPSILGTLTQLNSWT